MDVIQRFNRRFLFNYKNTLGAYSWKGYVIYRLINPFFQMMFFCMLANYVYDGDTTPWVIGNALTLCYFSAFFGVSMTFVSERMQGTLKSIMCSPTKTLHIIVPRIIMQSVDALISVSIGFITGAVFFGFSIPLALLGQVLLIILVAILSAMGMGLLIGAFALLTRDINMLVNIASTMLIIMTGANFPVDRLPAVLQHVSYALPLTRSIKLMRLVVANQATSASWNLLLGELALGVIFVAIGYMVFAIMERMAQKYATIDLY